MRPFVHIMHNNRVNPQAIFFFKGDVASGQCTSLLIHALRLSRSLSSLLIHKPRLIIANPYAP
jgi:hypothetical protein